jgi:glycosyltransferase involved in cell wall biosynthesis
VYHSAVRVLFVNGGILGLVSFHRFLTEWLPTQSAIEGETVLLGDHLSTGARVFRRLLCQRLWKDGALGLTNVDLARFRHELHAGLVARRRIASLAGRGFDLIHFHRQATAYGSVDLLKRVPAIVSVDCTQSCVLQTATSRAERASYGPNVRLDGIVFARAAAIISTSRWAAEAIRAEYPGVETPIHVLPNPVLLGHFDRAWIARRRDRARAGARPRLLFVGGDFPRKGGYDLLSAWAASGLRDRAELELATNWTIEGTLPPGVIVTRNVAPHSDAWHALWARADVFVMPTRNEAFGLVYQEAAAAGLPAIGTRHNAVPEIVLDGETGRLVPPGDPEALASAMVELVDSPGLRDRLGTRARAVIEESAAPEAYGRRLTAIAQAVTRPRDAARGA